MTESTATKVGVPGDKRLGDLKVNKPVPWYGKLPVVPQMCLDEGAACVGNDTPSASLICEYP